MMKRFQQHPAAENAVAARLAEIRKHRAELRARDEDLGEQDRAIPMTVAGVPPASHPAGYPLAHEMMNGFGAPQPVAGTDGEKRHRIQWERNEIAKADRVLAQRELETRADLIHEAMRRTADDWKSITRDRCLAILALRAANRRARVFREALAAYAGINFSLPADRNHPLFADPPQVGGPFYEFLDEAARLGAVTKKEINSNAE
jgi:hypothetical protein